MREVLLSALYLCGAGFVAWVVFKDGARVRLRPLGTVYFAIMVVLAPINIARIALVLSGTDMPSALRWMAPAAGLVDAGAIAILVVAPDVIGERIRAR